jgi:DNA primase
MGEVKKILTTGTVNNPSPTGKVNKSNWKGHDTMNSKQAIEYLKPRIEDYLSFMGINTRRNFRCLNPNHEDIHPSMSLDKRSYQAHCFSCGAKYDVFSLIGLNENLQSFPQQLKRACELYNVQLDDYKPKVVSIPTRKATPVRVQVQDYNQYFQNCANRITSTNYPQSRGLTQTTIEHFHLGFDEHFNQSTGYQSWKALIIPTGEHSFVARNTDPNADKKNRYRKVGESQLFNVEALNFNKPIFICEGELDALSIWELGKSVIGLGSTSNKDKFLSLLEKNKPTQPLILALDNDSEGQHASQRLYKGSQSTL